MSWNTFAPGFYSNPAGSVQALRQSANVLNQPELVEPLTGLNLPENAHHSIPSNVVRNYPIQRIVEQRDQFVADRFQEKAPTVLEHFGNATADANAFLKFFAANPADGLAILRSLAELQGRGELVADLNGLQISENDVRMGAPAVQNYPIRQIYEGLNDM